MRCCYPVTPPDGLPYPTDTAAQGTRSAVMSAPKVRRRGGEAVAGFRGRIAALQPESRGDPPLLFMFATKMATVSAVGREFFGLTSAASAVTAARGPTATPAGRVRKLHKESQRGCSACGHCVALLHRQTDQQAPPNRDIPNVYF